MTTRIFTRNGGVSTAYAAIVSTASVALGVTENAVLSVTNTAESTCCFSLERTRFSPTCVEHGSRILLPISLQSSEDILSIDIWCDDIARRHDDIAILNGRLEVTPIVVRRASIETD